MLLTVIIVNYNVKYYLLQCLESLRRSCSGLSWEVVVVDNNSTDGSLDYISQKFPEGTYPQLRVIANKSNCGFGRANNQAYRCSSGKYVLFLNPDTFVGEHTIKDCISFMESHSDAGCLGVKMLNADGSFAMESRRGVPTPWAAFCKISRLSVLFPLNKRFGRYYMQHLPVDEPAQIEIVSGAFMMVSRAAGDRMNVFDEDYFMHCEDIDLSYRMLKSRLHNYYLPSPILHYKGESTKRYTYSFVNTFYKAILIFFKKHFNHHYFLLRVVIYVALYLLGTLSFIRAQYRKCAYSLRTLIKPDIPFFLCLVNPDNTDTIRRMSERYGFKYEICGKKSVDIGWLKDFLQTRKCDFVVFDMEQYSYQEVLSLISGQPRKHRASVATFYSGYNILLTNRYIFTL